MDRFLFLREWEHFSGVTLSDEGRVNFVRECSKFMHYGEKILREALHIAKKNNNFGFEYIQSVASKLYEREHPTTPIDPPLSSNTGHSFSFSGLSTGIMDLGGGDYYDRREKRRRKYE